jgi:phosphoglycolate phosphatase-like HAD superfamily hydrolase
MSQPIIRHIIWDVDGTLLDSYPAISASFQKALADFGASAPLEEIEGLARVEVFHCASVLTSRFNLDMDQFIAAFGKHYMAVPPSAQPPFPGVKAVLERIVTAGGVNAIVTHRNAGTLAALLAAHELSSFFVESIARDDGYPRKPDPAAHLAILQHQRLDPAETLSIGDRELDILAGRTAGTRTCLFRGDPSQIPADLAISDYAELLEILAASETRIP